MKSEEGAQMINQVLQILDTETVEKLMKELQGTMDDGSTGLTALIDVAPEVVEIPATAETESEQR